MKQVVNGKIYDTETADLLHTWNNGATYLDFNYCAETLYSTKKGTFFLYEEGGASSPYAVSYEGGRRRGPGVRIRPLVLEGALTWLEKHGGTDIICAHPAFQSLISEA